MPYCHALFYRDPRQQTLALLLGSFHLASRPRQVARLGPVRPPSHLEAGPRQLHQEIVVLSQLLQMTRIVDQPGEIRLPVAEKLPSGLMQWP